jgi:hypothetical protein
MNDTEIQTTILKELRGSFEAYTVNMEQRVTTLETQMELLLSPVPASRPKPRPVLVIARRKK